MATYSDELRTYVYTDEATTFIRFPSDRQFVLYREDLEKRYSAAMVRVTRHAVLKDATVACVEHASNLGAELRGLAYGHYDGHTVEE